MHIECQSDGLTTLKRELPDASGVKSYKVDIPSGGLHSALDVHWRSQANELMIRLALDVHRQRQTNK